ncbi:MAG: hypothetical protein AAB225_05360 [Acidobacteriota bacterium]
MELTQQEAVLLEAVRRLPVDTVDEVIALTQRLASLALETQIDWSDSWSEADLRDYRARSLERLDQGEMDEQS